MTFQVTGTGAPGDAACTYGTSKLLFRGPKRSLDQPYIAFLGGSETFGRFVDRPFASLIESRLGRTCVNLGSTNGGLDTILRDVEVMRIAAAASMVVLQLPGVQGQSNRYYRVHPRRNDRFLQATSHLRRLYPEVDFTRFHFVRHLLVALCDIDPARFRTVSDDLQARWVRRMQGMFTKFQGRVHLLWLQYQTGAGDGALDDEPLLVTRAMLESVSKTAMGVVTLPVQAAIQTGDMSEMRFGDLQQPIAENMIGPDTHRRIAERLAEVLERQ
ncbi:DUF6473 family protein [Phaeobacter marinintestinus]|uniref:DUF6473 family protein n=1 Tax=Falsiphaeobacter marinintestinus TaxID=1492905 RepID=UPI001C95AE10|nr:DUF6473 family protein [Phaeobacter marinintestinus]